MSATVAPVSGLSSLPHFTKSGQGFSLHHCKTLFSSRGAFGAYPSSLFLRSSSYGSRRKSTSAPIRPFTPVMEWQDCRVLIFKSIPKQLGVLHQFFAKLNLCPSSEIEVDVPCSVAYDCYSDREIIPQWMPFISSVQVLQDKPDLSRWSLKYEVFGRDIELSWLARNMQPIPNQKIHWRSLDGLPNRGAVRFFPKGPSSCGIELTVSYEVPEILIPVASAIKPFLEGLLASGLERFAAVARNYQKKIPRR